MAYRVMPGHVPGIHDLLLAKAWMARTSPAMTMLQRNDLLHRHRFDLDLEAIV
jgi:hypothetical protein